MRNVIMYCYKPGSKSGALLREALGIRQIRHRNSTFRGGRNWTIINWGFSGNLPVYVGKVINNTVSVGAAANKLRCFEWLQANRVNIPDFTTSPQEARGWLRTGGVCIRHTVTGNSGEGLKIVSPDDLEAFDAEPRAPLYTKFLPSNSEWRVHVFDGEIIHTQKKLRRRDATGDVRIRNNNNGWVFSSNHPPPQQVKDIGIAAVEALGLDFGAVDIIFANGNALFGGVATVLEVNTAPGVEGVSLQKYVEAFQKKLG